MELTFTKEGNKWVTSFSVASDFNIHIEKPSGKVAFFQSAVDGGNYDAINDMVIAKNDAVYDKNVVGVICPMNIKVVADVEPTLAVVTVNEDSDVGYSEAQINETLNTAV